MMWSKEKGRREGRKAGGGRKEGRGLHFYVRECLGGWRRRGHRTPPHGAAMLIMRPLTSLTGRVAKWRHYQAGLSQNGIAGEKWIKSWIIDVRNVEQSAYVEEDMQQICGFLHN